MAKDPVCGMQVDEKHTAHTSSYEGRAYYFCAAGCKQAFAVVCKWTRRALLTPPLMRAGPTISVPPAASRLLTKTPANT